MRILGVLVLLLLATHILPTPTSGQGNVKKQPLSFAPVAGQWKYVEKEIAIDGELFENFGFTEAWGEKNYATFKIEGWDYFEGDVGVLNEQHNVVNSLIFKVDKTEVRRITTKFGRSTVHIKIPLSGARTLTIEREKAWPMYVVVANPTLIRGR